MGADDTGSYINDRNSHIIYLVLVTKRQVILEFMYDIRVLMDDHYPQAIIGLPVWMAQYPGYNEPRAAGVIPDHGTAGNNESADWSAHTK